ncbi:hypothetical protein THASP1DRAFT_16514 [Thamnocephalis sphaerospora]|uniref:Fe2OG dioxygenase domain-containing protein n=1 Tax=Thamnocephalis sphaerospora TaxID=78915 RepID=A0A4P9XPA2_9FUNG|nr:hypothetical protein THASP1DRAFT_16514 [Thamnocephalis sphaerospora]|eukprot:RKP07824.1 hypothetical protein THASP1DRAFT_16514 [Thamnocephalis sphaerospora]
MTVISLPIIDLHTYLGAKTSLKQKGETERAIDEACRHFGTFYLVNHGVPQELCDKVLACGHQFFRLPLERKCRHKVASMMRGYSHASNAFVKGHEVRFEYIAFRPPVNCYSNGMAPDMDSTRPEARLPTYPDALGEQNSWPNDEFRVVADQYLHYMQQLNSRLTDAIATSLGVGDLSRARMQDTVLSLTFNGYQALTEEEAEKGGINLPAHTDTGCITFLNQDSEAVSLHIQNRNGEWRGVRPVPGAFVVNIGSAFKQWTGGQYVDTVHRVVHRSAKPRVAVGVFVGPPFDAIVEPLPEFAAVDTSLTRSPPRTYGQFLLEQMGEYFASQER